jgi:hypothetical protein
LDKENYPKVDQAARQWYTMTEIQLQSGKSADIIEQEEIFYIDGTKELSAAH